MDTEWTTKHVPLTGDAVGMFTVENGGELPVAIVNASSVEEGADRARLIASAPRLKEERDLLLEACEASLSLLTDDGRQGGSTWTITKLRAAISKCQEG